jgi:hypothetical protein
LEPHNWIVKIEESYRIIKDEKDRLELDENLTVMEKKALREAIISKWWAQLDSNQ